MQLLHTARDLAAWREQQAGTTGLVPTMGNLHAGHRALLEAAAERCDRVIASVFVNPLQFGPGEDLDSYPRTPDSDRELLEMVSVDAVFAPSVKQMYPHGGESPTRIRVHGLSNMLCGHQRPRHFEGVATVVAKLFNLVQPDVAFFGEKDYQQLAIIRRMVTDLCMSVDVVGVPTVRESDGLALSSRNQYLESAERANAPMLAAALSTCIDSLRSGERDYAALEREGVQRLRDAGFKPDYFEIRDADLVAPDAATRAFRVLGAGTMGRARLIDNMGVVIDA